MRVYIGVDPRSPVSYNVLQFSIMRRASKPVAIVPLVLPTLPIKRRGLTAFTYSRYLCPALSGYQGASLFLDSDMLCLGDITEVFAHMGECAVYVVKNKQRFEWPSMMLFNNPKCLTLTPQHIEDKENKLHDFAWAENVGELPHEWNFCVGYDEPDGTLPKLLHYTAGVPAFPECKTMDFANEWLNEFDAMNSTCSWLEIMGESVHAELVLNHIQERKNRYGGVH